MMHHWQEWFLSLLLPPWPPQIHCSPVNNDVRWWLDHYFHRAPTCTGCLPWWIFVKKQNTTFIEINKRLRWQSDLLTIEEAHFSLTTAIAMRKDVFFTLGLQESWEKPRLIYQIKREWLKTIRKQTKNTHEQELAYPGFFGWNTRS